MSRGAIAVLAGLLAALALGFAWREDRAWEQGRARAAAALARHDQLAARLRTAQRSLKEDRRRRGDLERARASAAPATAGGASPSSQDGFTGWLTARPENRARYLAAYRARLASDWSLLFQALRLTPEQTEKLEDLLTQREDDWIAVTAAAAARGVPESDPEIQALDDRLDSANKAAIKALVGKAGYAQVHDYMHDEKVIPVVDQLAGEMVGSASPLTPEQAVGLTAALADSSQRKDSGAVIRDTIDWDQAMKRAGPLLDPAQLSVLSLVRDQNVAQAQSRSLMKSLAPAAYR